MTHTNDSTTLEDTRSTESKTNSIETEKPALPIAQAVKLVPFNEAYWTGWPTADNPYIAPATWWQVTHVILQHLEPVQH